MASDAVLNIRLPKDLKLHGNQVLERNGLSVTQVVRNLYEYMEREQAVPHELEAGSSDALYQQRRMLLRKVAGSSTCAQSQNTKDIRAERIMTKHGAVS